MKSLLLLLVVIATSAFGITGNDYAQNIPDETQFELRFDVKVLANAKAGRLTGDMDMDGVPDSEDYCPRTPAGALVWTKDTIAGGDKKNVGCAGGTVETSSGAITGNDMSCNLEMVPFNKERILHAGTVMSLVSVDSQHNDYPLLTLKTVKGTDLTFRCYHRSDYVRAKHLEGFFKLTYPDVEDITMK